MASPPHLLPLVFVALSLKDCSLLTRFSEESFDCTGTDAPFSRIVLSDPRAGDVARVEGGDLGPLTVLSVEPGRVALAAPGVDVILRRESGAVSVLLDERFVTYACKHAAFRM